MEACRSPRGANLLTNPFSFLEFTLAQRAFAARDSFLLVAADI